MNEIQLFNNPEFGEIRVAMSEDSEPLFCLADLCQMLALRQGDVRQRLSDGVVSTQPIIDSLGREQQANFVNEDGLYDAILESRKPEARKIRKWVTSEVLPSIRKNGAYLTDSKIEEVLTNPDTIIKLATQLKEERAEKQRLSLIADEQSNQLKLQAPKVEYCDKVLSSSGLLTVTMIADCIGISEIKLNKLLREWNVQYKESGTYHLYVKYKNYGYTETKPYPYTDSSGNIKTRQHMYWTEKGKRFILDCYARYQQLQEIKKGAIA